MSRRILSTAPRVMERHLHWWKRQVAIEQATGGGGFKQIGRFDAAAIFQRDISSILKGTRLRITVDIFGTLTDSLCMQACVLDCHRQTHAAHAYNTENTGCPPSPSRTAQCPLPSRLSNAHLRFACELGPARTGLASTVGGSMLVSTTGGVDTCKELLIVTGWARVGLGSALDRDPHQLRSSAQKLERCVTVGAAAVQGWTSNESIESNAKAWRSIRMWHNLSRIERRETSFDSMSNRTYLIRFGIESNAKKFDSLRIEQPPFDSISNRMPRYDRIRFEFDRTYD
ncbi:hypothetical protein Purlil1_13129 [Purpureocillium lilacinum]|uniref:Uncharacterized protein n=1 Tax=Purpureocillium lilacinum TaxID=33203 RepID=A0ABR0BFL1_PURLI|nr:hypothetical protein Purlil1_13129 [Purpureocillium lilacinum]